MNQKKDTKIDLSDIASQLKRFIPRNGTVILGLSGGPDSVFLLKFCLKTRKTHPFNIVAAHVNHGLRGKESNEDASFAEKLAEKSSCKFELLTIKKKPAGNLENGFREIRYAFFEKIRLKHKADLVLTAHHLNDNIETVLLNLTRGCHLDGLSGMETIDIKRHLFRPLLQTPKNEIVKFLKKNRIPFRNDSTNLDTEYSRNLIRRKIIPEFKKINPNLEKTFLRNISNFRSVNERSEKTTDKWIDSNGDRRGIKIKPFLDLDNAAKKDVIFHLYKNKYGNVNGLSQSHICQLLDIIGKNRAGLKKEFGPKFTLGIERSKSGGDKYIQILKKTAKQVQ